MPKEMSPEEIKQALKKLNDEIATFLREWTTDEIKGQQLETAVKQWINEEKEKEDKDQITKKIIRALIVLKRKYPIDNPQDKIQFELVEHHYGELVTALLAHLNGHQVSIWSQTTTNQSTKTEKSSNPELRRLFNQANVVEPKLGNVRNDVARANTSPYLFDSGLPKRLKILRGDIGTYGNRNMILSNATAEDFVTITDPSTNEMYQLSREIFTDPEKEEKKLVPIIRVAFYCRKSANSGTEPRELSTDFIEQTLNHIQKINPSAKIELILFGDKSQPESHFETWLKKNKAPAAAAASSSIQNLNIQDLRDLHVQDEKGKTLPRDLQVVVIRKLVNTYAPDLFYGPRSGLTLLFAAMNKPGIMIELPKNAHDSSTPSTRVERRTLQESDGGAAAAAETPAKKILGAGDQIRQTEAFLRCPVDGLGPLVSLPNFSPSDIPDSSDMQNISYNIATLCYILGEDHPRSQLSLLLLARYLRYGYDPELLAVLRGTELLLKQEYEMKIKGKSMPSKEPELISHDDTNPDRSSGNDSDTPDSSSDARAGTGGSTDGDSGGSSSSDTPSPTTGAGGASDSSSTDDDSKKGDSDDSDSDNDSPDAGSGAISREIPAQQGLGLELSQGGISYEKFIKDLDYDHSKEIERKKTEFYSFTREKQLSIVQNIVAKNTINDIKYFFNNFFHAHDDMKVTQAPSQAALQATLRADDCIIYEFALNNPDRKKVLEYLSDISSTETIEKLLMCNNLFFCKLLIQEGHLDLFYDILNKRTDDDFKKKLLAADNYVLARAISEPDSVEQTEEVINTNKKRVNTAVNFYLNYSDYETLQQALNTEDGLLRTRAQTYNVIIPEKPEEIMESACTTHSNVQKASRKTTIYSYGLSAATSESSRDKVYDATLAKKMSSTDDKQKSSENMVEQSRTDFYRKTARLFKSKLINYEEINLCLKTLSKNDDSNVYDLIEDLFENEIIDLKNESIQEGIDSIMPLLAIRDTQYVLNIIEHSKKNKSIIATRMLIYTIYNQNDEQLSMEILRSFPVETNMFFHGIELNAKNLEYLLKLITITIPEQAKFPLTDLETIAMSLLDKLTKSPKPK